MINVSMNIRNHPYVVRCVSIGSEQAEEELSDHLSEVCGDAVDELIPNLPLLYLPLIEQCVELAINRFNQLEKEDEA